MNTVMVDSPTLPENRSTVLHLKVIGKKPASSSVTVLDLARTDGGDLPVWEPGAHIDVLLPGSLVRHYSLCGEPRDRTRYRIGVLLDPNSRGGSKAIHETVALGDVLEIREPRNNFALQPSPRYHFIAGGIGITPLLPMIRQAQEIGADWHLTYLGRSLTTMAFLDEVKAFGDRATILPEDEVGMRDITAIIGSPAEEQLVYACGPGGLLNAIESHMSSWPAGSLKLERFVPKDVAIPASGDQPFKVDLTVSKIQLTVPADKSILDVVEAAGVTAPYSCREGTCGTCETRITAGRADHRDSLLSKEEQEANEYVMICVSRAAGTTLGIEL